MKSSLALQPTGGGERVGGSVLVQRRNITKQNETPLPYLSKMKSCLNLFFFKFFLTEVFSNSVHSLQVKSHKNLS